MDKEFNSIIVRQATDDYQVFVLAAGMQKLAGVEVVSIVHQNDSFWHVYAKFNDKIITPKEIDDAIEGEE